MPEPAGHVVLVGLMGSGKSTVGRAVADRLRRPFHDSDAAVEAAAGRTVAQLFAEEGEERFRARERACVLDLLDDPVPSVVATGGGAVLDEAVRARLHATGGCVWLRARPEELAARVGRDPERPLLGADPAADLRVLAAARADAYAGAANHVVDVDGLPPDAVVGRVLDALTGRTVAS